MDKIIRGYVSKTDGRDTPAQHKAISHLHTDKSLECLGCHDDTINVVLMGYLCSTLSSTCEEE